MAEYIKGYKLPFLPNRSTAVVYVIRPRKFLAWAFPFTISIDDSENRLHNGEVFAFIIKPGKHTFVAKSENKEEVTFTAKAKRVYFYQVNPRWGWWRPLF